MPGFVNPDKKPPVGGYTWVPAGPPSGDAAASRGFKQPVNFLGEKRNDWAYSDPNYLGTLKVSYTGKLLSEINSQVYPIQNTFRFLQKQGSYVHMPPSVAFKVTDEFNYTIKLNNATTLSGIQIYYSLAINLNDSNLDAYVTSEEQKKLLISSRSNNTVDANLKLDDILMAQILIDGVEYPTTSLDQLNKELPITQIYLETKEQYLANSSDRFIERSIRFGQNKLIITGFPSVSTIEIKSRKNISSLVFKLEKISLFTPKRCNLDDDQLPASAISYAFPVLFKVDSRVAGIAYPNAFQNRGTVNVKVFSRNFLSASPGFAHSINLRFLIASWALSNIDPLSLLSGGGINLTAGLYVFWFLGLWPERRNIRYMLSSYKAYYKNNKVAPLSTVVLDNKTIFIKLQKVESTSQPSNEADWADIDVDNRNLSTKISGKNIYIYDKNPTTDEIDGGYTKPFNYVDTNATNKTWYRVTQYLNNGQTVYSDPIKGQEHTELYPLFMTNVDTNRDEFQIDRKLYDSLDINTNKPIALFVSSDFLQPQSLELNKDSFKINIEAKKTDPNEIITSHLYFRFWFVPTNINLAPEEIFNFQDTHEVRFVSDGNATTLEIGKPRNYNETLVTPPLSNDRQKYSVTRYINNKSTIGTLDSFFQKYNVVIDGQESTDWYLAMGIYSVSYPTQNNTDNLTNQFYDYPNVSLFFDPAYASIETPFNVVSSATTTSGILRGSKLPQYTSIESAEYGTSLTLVNCKTGSRKVDSENDTYDKLLTVPSSQFVDNAFKDAYNLKTTTDIEKYGFKSIILEVPVSVNAIPDIPNAASDQIFSAVDFCTDGFLLSRGQINAGEWKIDFDLFPIGVNLLFKIEIYLVDIHGQIINSVYKSNKFYDQKNLTFNLSVPFIIPEGNYQILLRIIYFPYSNVAKKNDGNNKFQIKSLSISSHTIQRQIVSENDSAGGSVAFYEDLPFTPTQTIENNDFWFIAADDLLAGKQPTISDSNGELTVQGCLYSPSWLTNLPKNSDVEIYTYGLGTNPILFRTVPGESVDETSVSAVENKFSNSISVVYNTNSLVNTTKGATEIINTDDINSPLYNQHLINNNNKYQEGKNPVIVSSNTNQNSYGSNNFILTELDDTNGQSTLISANINANSETNWGFYNQGNIENNFGAPSNIFTGLKKNNYAVSDTVPEIYAVGIAQPGSIVLKIASLNLANSQSPDSINLLIDGPNVDYIDNFPQLISDEYNTVKAADTYPSVCLNNSYDAIVSYVMSDKPYIINIRLVNNKSLSDKYIALDLSSYLGSVPSGSSISGLNTVFDKRKNCIHVVFYFSNSLYYYCFDNVSVNSGFASGIHNLHFIAGDTSSENVILSTLSNRNRVFLDPQQSNDGTISKQKPGIFLANKHDINDNVFIWYKNSTGDIVNRIISPYYSTSNPKVYQIL